MSDACGVMRGYLGVRAGLCGVTWLGLTPHKLPTSPGVAPTYAGLAGFSTPSLNPCEERGGKGGEAVPLEARGS